MPKGLRRRYGLRHLHFITCSCYRRLPLFASTSAKNLFVKILGEVRDRYGFSLAGYVVMPNHIHILISEPATGTPSTVLQVLKQRVSRRLRRKPRKTILSQQLRLPFRHAHILPQIWQPRFYDFTGAGSTWSPPESSLESDEVCRETPLHAHESHQKKTGCASPKTGPGAVFHSTRRRNPGWFASIPCSEAGLESQVKSPALQKAKDGAPSITASALSRDTSTYRQRLRLVRSVFLFTYQESFLLPDQGSHRKSCGGTLVPPAIYSIFDYRP